jgi:hypothetical protein
MLHWPAVQVGVPCTALQPVPHPPQFEVSVAVLVSQPSRLKSSLALQSLQPMLHAMLHTPAVHAGVPFSVLHAAPHPPQLAMSASVLTSHPSVGMSALQSVHPALHA